MARRLIINIRGANASGKTTLARKFIEHGRFDGTTMLPMRIEGEPYSEVHSSSYYFPGLSRSVRIIGPYDESKYSGCDKIKSIGVIKAAVRSAGHFSDHILFEGFRVSKSYGPTAELRNELVRSHKDLTWLWTLMDAPVELIYERAAARREDGKPIDKEELAGVVRQMNNTKAKVKAAFPGEYLLLDPRCEPDFLFKRLLNEIKAREHGETLGPFTAPRGTL